MAPPRDPSTLPNFPVFVPDDLKFEDVKAAPLPGTAKPGQTGHYVNTVYSSNGLITPYSQANYPKTVVDLFEIGRAKRPDSRMFGRRKWDNAAQDWEKKLTWMSWNEVAHRRDCIGSALCHLSSTRFVPLHPRWTVGIWSLNRPEWHIVDQAVAAYDLVDTSLYETLGEGSVQYILKHSNCHVVFTAASHLPALLAVAPQCPDLKAIISLDNFADIDLPNGGPAVGALPKATVLRAWAQEKNLILMDLQELESLGEANMMAHRLPDPKAMASICYTSGTTGDPKGVTMSHEFIVASALSHSWGLPSFKEDGVFLSYLPLSHIYARECEATTIMLGGAIAFSVGDNLRLLEDFQIAQPDSSITVPRVLNRIYTAIAAQTVDAPGLKGALARRAFDAKIANFKKNGAIHHPVWDRLLMNKIKMLLGGKLEWMGSGSAPLSQKASEFLQVGLQFRIIEGYGSTETGGVTAKMTSRDLQLAGSVGPPGTSQMIKLVDVPDLGYHATDKPYPRGEICCKGPSVSTGYYKNEEATKEAWDEEGWFKTGDIGSFDECGRLRIIDRVKNLVKLAQGEYVAVESIENVYSSISLAQQVFIYADSLQSHLILFVVPDPAAFASFASSVLRKDISPSDAEALEQATQEPKVIEKALKAFDKEAVSRKLQGFERAKQLTFRLTPFSEAEGTLTPTMKIKRNVASKLLKERADALYKEFEVQHRKGAKI